MNSELCLSHAKIKKKISAEVTGLEIIVKDCEDDAESFFNMKNMVSAEAAGRPVWVNIYKFSDQRISQVTEEMNRIKPSLY